MPALYRTLALLALLGGLAAAAHADVPAGVRLLIFGETHDQPDQQRQVANEVQSLAGAARLAGVVLEMSEAPHSTAALPRDASEAQVRDALAWRGWPWPDYAAVVMNAVRAGVPVWGGNLPREQMRPAMRDATLDVRVDDKTRAVLAESVRSGHCNLLPAAQEPGMVRIQLARDVSIATVVDRVAAAAPAGSTVLLLTGAMHASRDRGVPLHLLTGSGWRIRWLEKDMHVVLFGDDGDGLRADERRSAVFTPQPDHCEGLRRQLSAGAASAPASAASR